MCLLLNNILLESIEFVGKSGSTPNICVYYSVAAFIAAALLQDLLTRNRSFSITTQTKRGSGDEKRFHQVEIGGDVVLTHCVDWPLDWTNCQSCCKITLQNALDHVL